MHSLHMYVKYVNKRVFLVESSAARHTGACVPSCPFSRSLEANDLLSGQSDELVEVKLDVLPPVAPVPAVGLSGITRAAWD